MQLVKYGLWGVAGVTAVCLAGQFIAAGAITTQAAGAGLQNAGWIGGHFANAVGTAGEFTFGSIIEPLGEAAINRFG